jgi:DNA-binding MarR family transcriptional regulator
MRLVVLANCEDVSQARLTDISEIAPSRLVRILNRLEAVSWVERRSDPHDRRAHVLAITESAKPVVERVWEIVRETSTEALSGVSSEELHLLLDVLERGHANLLELDAIVGVSSKYSMISLTCIGRSLLHSHMSSSASCFLPE